MNTERTPLIRRLMKRAIKVWKEMDYAQRRVFEHQTGLRS
jgi:hypothetical protein